MGNLSTFVKRTRDIMRNDAGINGDAQRIEQIAWMLFLKVYDAKEQDWEFNEEDYESIIPEICRWRSWAVDDRSGSAMTGDTLLEFVNNTLFPVLKGQDISLKDGTLVKGVVVTPATPIKKSIVKTTFEDANKYMKDGVLLRQVINVIDELDLSDTEESHAFGEIYESILRELQSAGSSGEFYTPRAVTEFMAEMIQPKIGEKMADFACGTGGFITSWLKALAPQIKTTEDQEKYDTSIYGIEKKQFPYMLCITNMLLHDLDLPQIYHDNSLLRDVLDYTDDDKFDVILMNPPYGGSEKADVKNHFPADLASSETADLFMSVIMYRLKKNGRAAVVLPVGLLFGNDTIKLNIKKKLLSEFNLHTIIRLPSSVFAPYASVQTNLLFFDNSHPTDTVWFYRMDMPEGYKHFSKTKPIKKEHFNDVIEWWNNRHEIVEDGIDKSRKYTIDQITSELNYNLDQCGYPQEEEEILSPEETIQQFLMKRNQLNVSIEKIVNGIYDTIAGACTSTIDYEVDSALNKVIKLDSEFYDKLKDSIVQFAMQGKLVKQETGDGDAKKLLEEISSYREKHGIKPNKKVLEITEDDMLFDIPDNWEWVRFGSIVDYNMGKTPPRAETQWWKDEYPWVSISDMPEGGHVKVTKEKVSLDAIASKFNNKVSKAGTLLMSFKLTVGKMSILDIDAVHNEAIISIYPCVEEPDIIQQYLFRILPLITRYGDSKNAIKGKTLNDSSIANLMIPLPPVSEQKRIVNKLSELLPMCEHLV